MENRIKNLDKWRTKKPIFNVFNVPERDHIGGMFKGVVAKRKEKMKIYSELGGGDFGRKSLVWNQDLSVRANKGYFRDSEICRLALNTATKVHFNPCMQGEKISP